MQENEEFNKYIDEFKKLSLKEKQKIAINQLKTLAIKTNNLCKSINSDNKILINKELIDLKNENYTEDDFVEAIIVLINSVQESICDFNEQIMKMVDKIMDSR